MAYKVRREIWRVLARNDYGKGLLSDESVWSKKRNDRKCSEISCNIVDLSLALEEFLTIGLIENDTHEFKTFILKWYRRKKLDFYQELDDDEVMDWVRKNPNIFVNLICKTHWGAIISQLVETAVSQRNPRLNQIEVPDKITNDEIDERTEFREKSDIDLSCTNCGLDDWLFDPSRGETYCSNCGYVTHIFLDTHDQLSSRLGTI